MSKRFRQGEHICALYDGEDEQIAIAAEYRADGLRAGQRCFYVAQSAAALTRFGAALIDTGIALNCSITDCAPIRPSCTTGATSSIRSSARDHS